MSRLRGITIDLQPLRDSRSFRLLWIGQTVSLVGSSITMVAVPYQLFQLTHSTLMLGLLGLCSLAPLLVAPLVGGAIADAVDRRKLIVGSELLLMATSALFAVNATLPHPQVWALFVLETVATAVFRLLHSVVRPVSTMPFASIGMETAATESPTKNAVGTVTLTAFTRMGFTLSVSDALMPPAAAVIVAKPTPRPDTTPVADTVATVVSELVQMTATEFKLCPFASRTATVSEIEVPMMISGVTGGAMTTVAGALDDELPATGPFDSERVRSPLLQARRTAARAKPLRINHERIVLPRWRMCCGELAVGRASSEWPARRIEKRPGGRH